MTDSTDHKKSQDMKIEALIDEVGALKQSISEITSLTKDSKIPIALKKLLNDSFTCSICHGIARAPIIVSMQVNFGM